MKPFLHYFPHEQALRKRPAAFTLVEVAVVVTIIGVLVMMLVGGVVRFSRIAASASCAQRVRQVGLSILAYAADNQNSLPGPLPNISPRPRYGAGGELYDYIAPYLSLPNVTGSALVRVGICPAAEPGNSDSWLLKSSYFSTGGHTKSSRWGYIPYPIESELPNNDLYRKAFVFGVSEPTSGSASSPWKVNTVPSPGKLPLLSELSGNWKNPTKYTSEELPPDPDSHCNVLFLDGHVETIAKHPDLEKTP